MSEVSQPADHDATHHPASADPPADVHLTAADAAAIDEWIAAHAASVAPASARARRVADLLAGLDQSCDTRSDRTLADVTFLRCLRSVPAVAGSPEAEPAASADAPELSLADRDALDSWILSGYDAARTPAALRPRAERHEQLAALITAVPSSADAALVGRTLAAVRAAQPTPLPLPRLGFPSARWADLASLAAMLLIAASVIWPVLSGARSYTQRTNCMAGLGATAQAFGQYAADFQSQLPLSSASLGGGRWWDVFAQSRHSNSSNFYTLARAGYVPTLNALACPSNAAAARDAAVPEGHTDWRSLDEISYSYQIMFGPVRPEWARSDTPVIPARIVVLSDRSPVVSRAVRGQVIDPLENSANHRTGQSLLHADGSSQWVTSPELPSGDNIWLPRPLENLIRQVEGREPVGTLQGTEMPASADDAFVGP